MDPKTIATGDYVFFFREGAAYTVPGAGIAGRLAKPGAADPGWIAFGVVESFDPTPSGEKEEEAWQPTGESGVLSRKDAITTKQGLELKIVTNEVTALAMETFYRTQALDEASAEFALLSKTPPKGWIKVQRFDQEEEAHLVLDAYARLKCTGGMKSGDGSLIKPEFSALVLYSPYNAGAI